MPIFEYLCKDCGQAFETIVPRYDSPADCIHCNSENVEKQLSVFAVANPSKDSDAGAGCGRCGAPEPGMCGMMD
jgi:putative FmdB family regulatory protein